MKSYRRFIAICLALVLALTGHSMAVARGSAPAVGHMVLCIGDGSVVVYMDETGAPTTAPHTCPDCTQTLNVVSALAPLHLSVRLSVWQVQQSAVNTLQAQQRLLSYLSRAPPALI